MLRVATFNVNSIRTREATALKWLSDYQPDLLALQETKVTDDLFPAASFEAAGYHCSYCGQKAYNGVALLSRKAPNAVAYGFDDGGPDDASRLLRADFDAFSIVNTYIPQGRNIDHAMYQYKIEWFARLQAWFDRHFTAEDPVLWVGDMNVAHDPIDVHNPEERAKHVCYHQDARDAFADCRSWGFIDTFRLHHPEGGHYTFFDYRNPNNVQSGKGWRIDYILATPSMARRCTRAYIDVQPRLSPKPSDHAVLVAEC